MDLTEETTNGGKASENCNQLSPDRNGRNSPLNTENTGIWLGPQEDNSARAVDAKIILAYVYKDCAAKKKELGDSFYSDPNI